LSHKTRRALSRANQTLGRKQLADDMCRLCGFVATEIIGHREQDFKLPDGSLVELGINKRMEPPLGIRFPKSAAKRTPCLPCGGSGKLICDECGGKGVKLVLANTPCQKCSGSGKTVCEKCAGFGVNWTREDFAPTCMLCSQFIMAWLAEREQLAMHRQGTLAGTQKIVLPSSQQARRVTGGIILPGR
jgi:hypothetical protein